MKVIKTIKPGQNGSRRFMRQYGERLVNVRYRKDYDTRSIFTTVEIIVAQRNLLPNVNQRKVYEVENGH